MCLILQETRFQVQVLNPCKFIQESNEKVLHFKTRQLLDRYYLLSSIVAWQILSIENYKIQISRFDFRPMLMYLCRVSFLTTLDIYKSYFKGRHVREYKENTCKRWPMPYYLWKKLLRLCALGFYNQVLLDLHCWWSEEFCNQQSSSSWWVMRP